MSRGDKRRQQKITRKNISAKSSGQSGRGNPQETLQQGVAFHQSGHLDEAIRWYEKTLSIQPDNSTALCNMGVVLQTQDRLDVAIDHYKKAIAVQPDFVEALSNLGYALTEIGELDEAIASLQKALALQPDHANALCNLGGALKERGDLDAAIAILNKAISIQPDYTEAYYNLGSTLIEKEDFNAAVVNLRKVLALNPHHLDALCNLGGVFIREDGFDQAHECLQTAISLAPESAMALYNFAIVRMEQGEYEDARGYIQKAIALDSGFFENLSNYGASQLKQGRLNAAAACFRYAISIDPASFESRQSLGNILVSQGKFAEAVLTLQKALALKPDCAQTMCRLGVALLEQGKLVAAITTLQKAFAKQPGLFEILNNLGIALTEQGKLDDAVACFAKAIAETPDNVMFIYNIGFTLEAMCSKFITDPGSLERVEGIVDRLNTHPEPDILHDESRTILDHDDKNCFPVSGLLEQSILKHKINKLVGNLALEDQETIINNLPSVRYETLQNVQRKPLPTIISQRSGNLPQMVALLGMANAGSGLFHSQLDGHPEISIMPGVYMSGFFGRDVWQKIVLGGYENSADKFADLYRVLFDSRNQQKPPPPFIGDSYGVGQGMGVAEGFDKLGENFDSPLLMERRIFTANLEKILVEQESINHGSFFQHVHHAYEQSLGHDFKEKKIILNHIHKLNQFNMSNLIKNFPDARLLNIIRNPVQGCEAWALKGLGEKHGNSYKKYNTVVSRVGQTIRDINSTEFSTQDSVGIRLEDIKQDSKATMERLCAWLGIADSPTLYESTIQGLQWWGDPSSILFGKKQTDDHGKSEPIRRKIGTLFSERDRYILETLFYPFNVRFDYVKKDQNKFLRDLQVIRPLLERPFDFEQNLSKGFPKDFPDLENTAAYKSFHAILLGRWCILDKEGTYTYMFKQLPD